MPEYQYICKLRHTHTLFHPFSECDLVRVCPECGTVMHRIPQAVSVNWNGLPPHLEHTRPKAIQNFIDTEHQRRDEYIAAKETYNNEKERTGHG